MANELQVAVSATLTNGYSQLYFNPGTIQVTQAAIGGYSAIVSVGTSEEDLSIGDVSTLGWLFLRNLDTTNYVTYGAKDTTMKALGRIKAGEVACLRLEPGITLRWIANTAAVKVQVHLLENVMADNGIVQFNEQARRDIAETVLAYRKRAQHDIVVGAWSAPMTAQCHLGFTDAAIAKGASGTVSIYNGTPGSETDTGVNVTAYNRFAAVAISKYVWVQNNGHGWYLTAAECT